EPMEVTRPAGVVFVALQFDALAQASFDGLGPGFLHCILDITDGTPRRLTGNGACPDAAPASGPALAPRSQWHGEVPLAGRRLELRFESGDTEVAASATMASAAAMFGALTLAAFLLSLAGRSAEVARLVERRTAELAGEMTIRRRITAALARSEQRLRTLLASTPAGIVEMAPDTRIAQANSYFCQLIDVREPALVGRSLLDLVHPDERAAEANAWSSLPGLAAGQIPRRLRLRREGGGAVCCDSAVYPSR